MSNPPLEAAMTALLDKIDASVPENARTGRTHQAPSVRDIPAHLLFADSSYQRDIDRKRVRSMAAEYRMALVGVLEVSERPNGRFAIVEGQHRWAAGVMAHGDKTPMTCRVHTGLTVQEEAQLFYDIDIERKKLSTWDRWKARRGTNDPVVAEVEDVVGSYGLHVNPGKAPGSIGATAALEKVYMLGGGPLLSMTIGYLNQAYQNARDAYDNQLICGLALVIDFYAHGLDDSRMVEALQGIAPRLIKSRAAALREAQAGVRDRLVAAVIVTAYNTTRGRNLEEFPLKDARGKN